MTRFTSHLYGLNIPIKEVKSWENIWEAMPYLNVIVRAKYSVKLILS